MKFKIQKSGKIIPKNPKIWKKWKAMSTYAHSVVCMHTAIVKKHHAYQICILEEKT